MNSNIQKHFGESQDRSPTLETALDRLGAWLDEEQEILGTVLTQAGRDRASHVLEQVSQMHLEPWSGESELRDLLESALVALEYMLETLRGIPNNYLFQTAWGLPGPEVFDWHVRWSGTRLQDTLAALRQALDA